MIKQPPFLKNAGDDDDEAVLPSLLVMSTIQEGLSRKVSPWYLQSWVLLSLTLDGRDKITKFLQYLSRLLAYLYQRRLQQYQFRGTPTKNDVSTSLETSAEAWKALYLQLSISRKAFRLGRSMVEVDKLNQLGLATSIREWWKSSNVMDTSLSTKLSSVIKILGLAGFWAGDNMNFLTSIGFLDGIIYTTSNEISPDDRTCQQIRQVRQHQWAFRANQSYFIGSLAGLWMNSLNLYRYRQDYLHPAYQLWLDAKSLDEKRLAQEQIRLVRERLFCVTLDLLKSCCDVLVFSNNPGMNFWEKYSGRKLHEVIHCIGGMISAAVVMFHQYPNRPKS
jgi:Peroxisomal biogenesis factor 11 (PEX11)